MDTIAMPHRLREPIIRYYELWRRGGLRSVFKRLMIFGIAGLFFVLGANYLLVYTVQFGQHPDSASEQRAKAALDEASRKGLSKTRAKILQNYLEDLERCYQGQRDSCKQASSDMNEAMRAPAGRQ